VEIAHALLKLIAVVVATASKELSRGGGRARSGNSDPPALVFGDDITGLAVLRALGRRGVEVYGAGTQRKSVVHSRWYRPLPGEGIDETSDGERLAAYLRTLPFPKAVLFPCSDRWALAVASLPEDVADTYASTIAPLDVLRVLIDKGLFARAVAEHDVPAPRAVRVADAGDLDAVEDDELPSFFLKPMNSQLFGERFGVKALSLESRARAVELLGRMVDEGLAVLLQEYVPGPPTAHVFLDGYVDRCGVMGACLARRRLRMYPRKFGNSTLSVTIPLTEAADAVESLCRLFDGLGYVGLFDAEFKQDSRDGRFKILEVNARPWWQLELASASGLDVCGMAFQDALGRPIPPVPEYRVGRTWVHPLPDLRAWWDTRAESGVAPGPLRAWFGGANAVFSWDDPEPGARELVRVGERLAAEGRSLARARLSAQPRVSGQRRDTGAQPDWGMDDDLARSLVSLLRRRPRAPGSSTATSPGNTRGSTS